MFKLKARNVMRTNLKLFKQILIRSYFRGIMDFHITFPDKPVYLERSENNDKIDDGLKGETDLLSLSNLFTNLHEIFLFYNIFKGDNDEISNYLKSAIDSQKLLREIVENLAGTTSSHHGPYDQGYTRATMGRTKGRNLARAS